MDPAEKNHDRPFSMMMSNGARKAGSSTVNICTVIQRGGSRLILSGQIFLLAIIAQRYVITEYDGIG